MQDISQWKEEELRKELEKIITSPTRSQISTSDIRVGMMSSTCLNEKVGDITLLFDTLHHKAITEERERIVKALIEQAEPYENSKWHNQLSIETIKKIISNE